jgi:hypothetical protein
MLKDEFRQSIASLRAVWRTLSASRPIVSPKLSTIVAASPPTQRCGWGYISASPRSSGEPSEPLRPEDRAPAFDTGRGGTEARRSGRRSRPRSPRCGPPRRVWRVGGRVAWPGISGNLPASRQPRRTALADHPPRRGVLGRRPAIAKAGPMWAWRRQHIYLGLTLFLALS